MKKLDQFHDGHVEGLLIEGAKIQIFLSTEDHQAFVLELKRNAILKSGRF